MSPTYVGDSDRMHTQARLALALKYVLAPNTFYVASSDNRDQRVDPTRRRPPAHYQSGEPCIACMHLSGFEGTGTQHPVVRATIVENPRRSYLAIGDSVPLSATATCVY